MKIAFVGGGHITAAILAGMRAGERTDDITVADRNPGKRKTLRERFAVAAADSQSALPPDAEMLILAVKPADIRAACGRITQRRAIVVSVAAGIPLSVIAAWMPFPPRYAARAMPNTPLAAAAGMTVCCADVPAEIKAQIGALFSSAGEVFWAKNEAMLQAATAVSGCGPAYLYYLAEAMEEAAKSAGFSAAEARLLVSQTMRGGGAMLSSQRESAAELRRAVAVKGGATERAIAVMQSKNFRQIVQDAMQAARDKADEIAAKSKE